MHNYYIIYFAKLLKSLTPNVLRVDLFLHWMDTITHSLQLVYSDWYSFYFKIDYQLKINSQVCRIRKVLNDEFDYSLRRITLGEGQYYDRKYIYLIAESKPKYLPMVIQSEIVYADSGYDFTVFLNGVVLNADEKIKMEKIINENKLVGKRYKIV